MMPRWPWLALGLLGAGSHAGEAARAPYEDRVLDESPQAVEDTAPATPDTGWRRGGSLELQSLRQSGLHRSRNETLQLDGFLDTANLGTFSTNLNINRYR